MTNWTKTKILLALLVISAGSGACAGYVKGQRDGDKAGAQRATLGMQKAAISYGCAGYDPQTAVFRFIEPTTLDSEDVAEVLISATNPAKGHQATPTKADLDKAIGAIPSRNPRRSAAQ